MKKIPVITLDGPSGTGKGTLCHRLAKHLGFNVLDSGSIYRALAYYVKKKQVDFSNQKQIIHLAQMLPLRFHENEIYVEGEEVSSHLRTEECGQNASRLAVCPDVRTALLDRQRQFAQWPGLVTDGRDMGTVVFPEADLKIYLDASLEARTQRRYAQLKKSGQVLTLEAVQAELMERDLRDKNRSCAPLMQADDAIYIDTSDLSIEEVFLKCTTLVELFSK